MKRLLLTLAVAALGLLALAAVRKERHGADICAMMTPARLLSHPDLADAYAEALRTGDADEVGRIEDMMRRIRSAHGCRGDVALPSVPQGHPALPPGHPPLDGHHGLGDVAPFSSVQDPVNI